MIRLVALAVVLAALAGCGANTPESAPSPSALPTFPAANTELTQGGAVWAVVLAGARDVDDPALAAAVSVAHDAGFETGPTDCDEGAAAALGRSDGLTVSVYFAGKDDAQAAAAAFAARGVTGTVAQVRTYCLD